MQFRCFVAVVCVVCPFVQYFTACSMIWFVRWFLFRRGQTVLSWGALLSAHRRDSGPTDGAAGLLLNASRSLFPLAVGSFARLLSSLVHSQVIGGNL